MVSAIPLDRYRVKAKFSFPTVHTEKSLASREKRNWPKVTQQGLTELGLAHHSSTWVVDKRTLRQTSGFTSQFHNGRSQRWGRENTGELETSFFSRKQGNVQQLLWFVRRTPEPTSRGHSLAKYRTIPWIRTIYPPSLEGTIIQSQLREKIFIG